jgi:hypothetical protein
VLTTAVALVVVAVLAVRGHVQRRPAAPSTWLWLLAEVERHAVTTRPADAVVGVCLHGPPHMRRAARVALETRGGVGDDRVLGVLGDRLATVAGDRLCATAAALARTGGDAADVLAALRASERDRTADAEARRAAVRVGRAGTWLLLAPLAVVATGAVIGPPAHLLAATTVAGWWLGSAWVATAAEPPRVFVGAGSAPAAAARVGSA